MHSLYLSFSAVLIAARFANSSPISSKNTGENSIGDIIDLGYAKYQGATNGLGINEFLGLRYAAPPLGELRFRAPRDPLNETGIIKADSHGPICLGVIQPFVPSNPSDEDCLFIDVYGPSTASTSSRLPVVLWIQGGAYITNFDADFNGSSLIRSSNDNLIVVTFNYRVGAYGFLASDEIRKNGDLNVGLLDQRKAMEWTKKHIQSFGGNPEHIVLMGTSSGGGSVLHHLASFGGNTSDLFVGGIASSSYSTHVLPVEDLEYQYEALLQSTNCSTVTCLRSLPIRELQAANIARPYPGSNQTALFTYAPCIDNYIFSDSPTILFQKGKFAKVPLLLGNTEDEGTIFGLEANATAQVSSVLKTQYPEFTQYDLKEINKLYPYNAAEQNPNHTPYFPSASAAYGEGMMTCPSLHIAQIIAESSSAVWDYRYNVRDPANIALGLGVPHTWEIDAVWGPGFAVNPLGSNSYSNVNAPIVPVVQGYWQSFIRDLNPNTFRAPGSPKWERFVDNQWLLIQTNNTKMEIQTKAEADRCAFWRSISCRLHQ